MCSLSRTQCASDGPAAMQYMMQHPDDHRSRNMPMEIEIKKNHSSHGYVSLSSPACLVQVHAESQLHTFVHAEHNQYCQSWPRYCLVMLADHALTPNVQSIQPETKVPLALAPADKPTPRKPYSPVQPQRHRIYCTL